MTARGSCPPLIATATVFLLVACGIRNRTEMRWIGQLTPEKPSERCMPTRGILTLRADIVTFAPDEGIWVLSGTARPNTLTATKSRPTADHKLYQTNLQADWNEDAVRGTYTTPECTYHVDLARLRAN